MALNSKNRLQEFCQKNRIALPKYELFEDNQNGYFQVKCSILYDTKCIESQGYGLRIKEAEKIAADNILNILDAQERLKVNSIRYNGDRDNRNNYIAIYLDMENINVKILEELFRYNQYEPNYFIFIGCLSTGHHYASTTFDFGNITFEKVLVPSTRSDATDIGMIMHAMSHHGGASNIIFVSRDRFSCVFVELASKGFCFNTHNTHISHASNIEEMKLLLDSYNLNTIN